MANQGRRRGATTSKLTKHSTPRVSTAGAAPKRKISSKLQEFSGIGLRDLRFEVDVYLPGRSKLERVSVHRFQSLISFQAALQRQFQIPFEQQRLYSHGKQLEGDDDVYNYGLRDKSVVVVRVVPRFRRIGDVFATIRTICFPDTTSKLEDFQIVEVPAGLPPLRIVLQRIVCAITYLTTLDRMQAQRTHRSVWRQQRAFWDDPSSLTLSPNYSGKQPSSYVLQTSAIEHVPSVLARVKAHGVQSRLQTPSAIRSATDIRNLKKWFTSLKYFVDAQLPDAVFQELARTSTYLRVNAGDFVFRQEEPGDVFYVLITGCVSLAAYGIGFFHTLVPGFCFGEISLIKPQGLRTVSASATFATVYTELAVVSGDLYRRAIKPHKQVVLRTIEKSITSIPHMHALPPHVIIHLAYAARQLTAREGKHLICREEEINVLVLLVHGSVKIRKPPLHRRSAGILAVVQAPAVLGQEGTLAITTSRAPWDVIALDTCSLICLRKDTIASFLSPLHNVVRALLGEHNKRLEDFRHRFDLDDDKDSQASEAKALDSELNDVHVDSGNSTSRPIAKGKGIVFPHILVREETMPRLPTTSRLEELARPVTSDSIQRKRPLRSISPRKLFVVEPSCIKPEKAQDSSRTHPFSGAASRPKQLQYVWFDQQYLKEPVNHFPHKDGTKDSKTAALLSSLRRLAPEDVFLLPVDSATALRNDRDCHYRFAALNSPKVNI